MSDTLQDYYNLKVDRSISAHNIPQSFVNALVYEMPIGKGRKYLSNLHPVANPALDAEGNVYATYSGRARTRINTCLDALHRRGIKQGRRGISERANPSKTGTSNSGYARQAR